MVKDEEYGSVVAAGAASPPVPVSLITCRNCSEQRPTSESWWCSTCAVPVCKHCNLLNKHTEHRSSPWRESDVLTSCAYALEARCAAVTREAADEEIAIKEFVAELEEFLIDQVRTRLERETEPDRQKIKALNAALGSESAGYVMNRGAFPMRPHQSDEEVERLLQEAARYVRAPHLKQTLLAGTAPPKGEQQYNGDAGGGGGPALKPKRSFAFLPHDQDPSSWRDFLSLLDARFCRNESGLSPRHSASSRSSLFGKRAFPSASSANGHRAVDGAGFRSDQERGRGGSLDFADSSSSAHRSTSTPLDGASPGMRAKFDFPLEPEVSVSSVPPLSPPQPPAAPLRTSSGDEAEADVTRSTNKSVDSFLSRPESQPSSSEVPMDRFSVAGSVKSSPPFADGRDTSVSNRSIHLTTVGDDSRIVPPLAGLVPSGERTPTPTTGKGFQDSESSPESDKVSLSSGSDSGRFGIMSFYFGYEYLTRPIDVCSLPDGRLAVSDSCGGVYVTKIDGTVLSQIPVKSSSASSVFFCTKRQQLLVSVMHKLGRSVHIYGLDGKTDGNPVEDIPCPAEPKIDQSRTRWIATNSEGTIYMASGDNRIAALWQYNDTLEDWLTIRQTRNSRYQYLQIAEDRPETSSTVLMTCEGVAGSLLLFVVGKNGQIWSEYNLSEVHGLGRHLRSPASALLDPAGNVLVLDYPSGSLYVLYSEGRKRKLKEVGKVGPQQGLGIAALAGWAFVACFQKKRVQAYRYLEPSGERVLSGRR